ncbi:hypothetical protein [Brachybacterium sp.]|uniref:hypothetical protein n=1 Tax=Brachybacterium sp. TaxID=1891286 RepID=UPI002ED210DF
MDASLLDRFPESMPEVRIEVLEEGTDHSVLCDELQWWFVVPCPGETTTARWYDRATGQVTSVRESERAAAPLEESPDSVRFGIRETTFPTEGGEPVERLIRFTAQLTSESATFLSVEVDGARSDSSQPGFAENWGDARGRLLRDGNRLVRTGPRDFHSERDEGARADLVDLSIGGSTRRALRLLDLGPGAEPSEFGEAVVDLETGRTLVYWQYRPEGWDADADLWWAAHPGEGLVIDGVRFQRRNCTGRDEIALTDHAVRLLAP